MTNILTQEELDRFHERKIISIADYSLIKQAITLGYGISITHKIPEDTRVKESINIQLFNTYKINEKTEVND